MAGHRNPLARLWDLTGNAEWTNLESSKKNLDDSAKDFEEAIASNSEYQVHEKLGDVKNSAADLDRKVGEYLSASKSSGLEARPRPGRGRRASVRRYDPAIVRRKRR